MNIPPSLALTLAAGTMIAPLAHAQTPPAIGLATSDAPRRLTGHLYFNAATGASVFTPAKEYLANRARMPLRALGDDINADGVPDLWINTNTDPCPIGTPTDPYIQFGNLDYEDPDAPGSYITGDHHLYKCQLGEFALTPTWSTSYIRDVRVRTLTFTFWTDLDDTDTNLDTVPDGNTAGLGLALSFWDREDYFGKTCCGACPFPGQDPVLTRRHLNTFEFTDLPGTLTPGELAGTIVTVELAPDQVFELADSDGIGPASGVYNPLIAAIDIDTNSDATPDVSSADTDSNGSIDWAYSLHGIQPTDGRSAHIAYTLAAPGRFGPAGQFAIDGVTPLNPQAGGSGDGLFDYINRTTAPAPLQWSNTRITFYSIDPPMGRGFPFTSSVLPVFTTLSRFSLFFASLGEQPDPYGPPPISLFTCAGLPNSDFFGWGAVHPPNGAFYGDLNCVIDDDGDTVPEGRPWSGAFLALSATADPCPADLDSNGTLTIDDIDVLVSAFLRGLVLADCDASGTLNLDDVDCFVASFLAGCP